MLVKNKNKQQQWKPNKKTLFKTTDLLYL